MTPLAERGILEDISDLVFAGFSAVERGFSPNHANDVFGGSAAHLRQQRDQMNSWGYNALSEGYIRLGRLARVKDLLIQQDDILNRLRPADSAPAGDKFRFAETKPCSGISKASSPEPNAATRSCSRPNASGKNTAAPSRAGTIGHPQLAPRLRRRKRCHKRLDQAPR